MSRHIHGNPAQKEKDTFLRNRLRELDFNVVAVPSILLDDKPAMVAVISRIAKYVLGKRDGRRVKADTDWFDQKETTPSVVADEHVDSDETTLDGATVVPFRRLDRAEIRPWKNCVPLYDLEVAAGKFSREQMIDAVPPEAVVPEEGEIENIDEYDWVTFEGRTRPDRRVFVAQVLGESMNRRIPNGAWCAWRLWPGGSRQGKVVLAADRRIADPEHGGRYTVKVYESEKEATEDGSWRHRRIFLKPHSTAKFDDIVLEDLEEGALDVVAELVEVLRPLRPT